jgi:uncharacterized protein (TIGR04255 family)
MESLSSMPQHVKFGRPPVVEVVCGTCFETSTPLLVPHIGRFWSTLKDRFPRIAEAAPISASEDGQSGLVRVELMDVPALPRTWFISEDGRDVIQLQRDWFLFNWKRSEEGDEYDYPSYPIVIEEFEAQFAGFVDFLHSENIGDLRLKKFELTYVNHIDNSNGLRDIGEGNLFVDHVHASYERFLPNQENWQWRDSYVLPNNFGRLSISAQTGLRKPTGERVVRLDLQARGIPPDTAGEHRRAWFDVAHEWITRGFADITSSALHKIWERTL